MSDKSTVNAADAYQVSNKINQKLWRLFAQ